MWLFGHDDPMRDGEWEDRHPRRDLEPLEAIVVAPDGHHNTMYRDLGEDDVMRVVRWAMAIAIPSIPARVTITGPSMGGIGTAACALHHPDRFAAAEPLCGYHSYFVRRDAGRGDAPLGALHRGGALERPLGRKWPLPASLHRARHQGPPGGEQRRPHRSLQGASLRGEGRAPRAGAQRLARRPTRTSRARDGFYGTSRPVHPRAVRFKTPRTRWADDAWLHVRELASSDQWGEVIARIDRGNTIHVSTRGVAALALDRDGERVDDASPVTVIVDGDRMTFQADEPIAFHRAEGKWRPGTAPHEGLFKQGAVTGPIRDVFHEPILFVWGASDPAQARANEEVARAWARVRWGVHVDYPAISDVEFAREASPSPTNAHSSSWGTHKSNLRRSRARAGASRSVSRATTS